ncbi:MAG: ABC transporter substrate-binding protein [Geothrix sp.]|nr:ABC transporter substrate-binding protein [Geothrix sp.]
MRCPTLVLRAAFAVSICGASLLQGADPLNLSIPLPLTGGQAKFGEMMKRSYEMATDEINAKGGVKGRKVILAFEDSQAKADSARAIVEKLIDVKKQPIIIGEYTSACAKAVAAVANERKTPYLIVASADDAITQQNYKYVFRQNVPNAYYAQGLVSFFKDVVKPQSIAILFESSDFGTSGAADMEKHAQRMGMKVVLKEKYEKGAVDFKPILSKVKQAAPDVIFMVSYVMDASLLMKQLKELRVDAKLFAGGAAGFALPEFVDNAKDAAEYVVTATLWTPQVKYKGAKEYADKYKAKFGDFPSYHGASAYSAMYVVQDVLTRAKSLSQEDITAAMKKTDLQTAYGHIKFEDRDGYQNQCFSETFVLQVQKGEHQTVWPATYANQKYLFPIPKWRDRK